MWNKRRTGAGYGNYGNKKTDYDGHSFSSKLEASVYALLKAQMNVGEIKEIQLQDHVYLSSARILYIPDFKCTTPDGEYFWVEAKGFETPVWRIKRKMWKAMGPGPLLVYSGSAARPQLKETLIPTLSQDLKEDSDQD